MTAFSTVPAYAAVQGAEINCGTIIIPPGLGIGPGSDVTSFNPLLVDSLYNTEAADLMFMPLFWINRYHLIDWSRSIASSVASPDGGKTYNVTLRSWHWSDGVAVTTKDVAYTLQLIKQLGATYPGYGSGGMPDIIQALALSDATHFTVTLRRPVNQDWFILNGLSQLQPLPAHVWGGYSVDDVQRNQSSPAFFQVVNGPLRLKSFTVGMDAEFVPNPTYEGPKMHFDRFIMKFMNSEGSELQAVESHELDMSNLPFALWKAARHLPGVHVETLPPSYSWHQMLLSLTNPATPFFADVRVRQAIADAIDQRQMIGLAMHGQGVAVYGPVPPQPATFLSPAARRGHYAVGYDPERARSLLIAAGFTPGADGIMQKAGHKLAFTLLVPAGQAMRIEMAETMQQNLAAVGIALTLHQMELNHMFALGAGPAAGWQAMLYAEDVAAYPSGEGLFSTGAYYNSGHYSDPTMDRMIHASTDEPGLQGLFDYQDYASAQQPLIFLPVEQYSVLVRNGLHGVQDFMNPLGAWAPDQLYCAAP